MIRTNIHVMTSQGRIHVLCVISNLQQKETWWDTEPYTLEKTGIHVLSVRSIFQLRISWLSIWIFIPANASAQNVADVVWVEVNWQCTGEVIQERNRLNVMFVTSGLHIQVALLCTAEFTVERNRLHVLFVTSDLHSQLTLLGTEEFTVETNHSNVVCVAKYFQSMGIYRLTWEFTRERNLTSVHCVTKVSPSPATCRHINVVYTATVDHIIVLTVECSLRQTLNWSIISVFTLMQSRTHVDTAQISLDGIINSRHIYWSHTKGTWFTCDICQKKFSRSDHLKLHLLEHKQVKSYVCSECPKRFCAAAALKSHQLVHSSLQQFCCGKCGKYFKHKHHVVRHFDRCSDDRLGIISLFNPRVCQ